MKNDGNVWQATNETPPQRIRRCYQRNSHHHFWPSMNQKNTESKFIWDYEGPLLFNWRGEDKKASQKPCYVKMKKKMKSDKTT